MVSHTQNPFAERIEGNVHRIYFSSRDARNRSHISWVEIDLVQPAKIMRLAEEPVLGPGEPGSFDDAGVMTSCFVRNGDRRFLYYIAWNLRSAPYHLSIGLATALGDVNTTKFSRRPEPIIDRSPADPLFCTSPFVLPSSNGWRMWYLSGLGWPKIQGRVTPSYNVHYAESHDGVHWRPSARVILDLAGEEVGFSRPCVVMDDGTYSMWYSVRGRDGRYRLGFARSGDGLAWVREDDKAGLDLSNQGWDSEMIAYPHVFAHGLEQYMLYCGNDYGRTGFGLAVWS